MINSAICLSTPNSTSVRSDGRAVGDATLRHTTEVLIVQQKSDLISNRLPRISAENESICWSFLSKELNVDVDGR